MAAPEPQITGLNLEKELVCFICTEILYQPLTLLDCLHTFCGSCLKEWFSHQHRKASHAHAASTATPYTCPTCRAPVKDAQHNAMINTLLAMFLAANPTKDRSADEKAEMAHIYQPGVDILPKVEAHRRRERRRRDEEDTLARERRAGHTGAHERSRRDDQLHPHSRHGPGGAGASASRSRERRDRRDRSREAAGERQPSTDAVVSRIRTAGSVSSADFPSASPPPTSPRHPDAVEARQRGARTVAHQASLISIVSASESGTGTGDSLNEAQLMQEILAEGLLDGINVDTLTEAEQDELSEVIAERYRQMYPDRVRRRAAMDPSSTESSRRSEPPPEIRPDDVVPRPRHSSRSSHRPETQPSPRLNHSVVIGGSDPRSTPSSPQPAVEQTLTPPPSAHRRRPSNESGRSDGSTSRTHRVSQSSVSGASRTAATRSATDLSDRPQSIGLAADRPRQLSNPNRSNTEPRTSTRASEMWQAGGRPALSPPQAASSPQQSPRAAPAAARTVMSSVNPAPVPSAIPLLDPASIAPELITTAERAVTPDFPEPAVTCARCSRPNIQYEVYAHCAPCQLDLCRRCYRAGRGCNHWYGFGHAAMLKFDASHPSSRSNQAMELPHMLVGRQYPPPPSGSGSSPRADPNLSLREGNFCDRCGKFDNDCFWSCDYCNDGEWGFCNDCVNTNHCCNHPLLPITHKLLHPTAALAAHGQQYGADSLRPQHNPLDVAPSPAQSAASSATSTTAPYQGPRADFVPLVITTNCDMCTRPIAPFETRFHCPDHPTPVPENAQLRGDFDMCSKCYNGLVKTGRLPRGDGPDGWRLCPSGHRMIELVFEVDRDGGQRRVVVRDVVGGKRMTDADVAAWKLSSTQIGNPPAPSAETPGPGLWTWRDDSTGTRRSARAKNTTLPSATAGGSRLPPDGGVGKVCRALWSYYPEDGDEGQGELLFPRHAEVREIEQVNEDWWFGVYAGDAGVFPAVYVREVG